MNAGYKIYKILEDSGFIFYKEKKSYGEAVGSIPNLGLGVINKVKFPKQFIREIKKSGLELKYTKGYPEELLNIEAYIEKKIIPKTHKIFLFSGGASRAIITLANILATSNKKLIIPLPNYPWLVANFLTARLNVIKSLRLSNIRFSLPEKIFAEVEKIPEAKIKFHIYQFDKPEDLLKISEKDSIILLANPVNPSATFIPSDIIEKLSKNSILIIDGAYWMLFVDFYKILNENIIFLTTLSKIGAPNERIGILIVPKKLHDLIEMVRIERGMFTLSDHQLLFIESFINNLESIRTTLIKQVKSRNKTFLTGIEKLRKECAKKKIVIKINRPNGLDSWGGFPQIIFLLYGEKNGRAINFPKILKGKALFMHPAHHPGLPAGAIRVCPSAETNKKIKEFCKILKKVIC